MNCSGMRIGILGCGRSGRAAALLARARGAASVTVLDSGDAPALAVVAEALEREGIRVVLGEAALAAGTDCDLVVASPGIDPSWPLVKPFLDAGTPVVAELEFGFRDISVPFVAVTGTNGKTTTVELVSDALNAAGERTIPCANYGKALCEVALEGADGRFDVLTAEVSSFQLELIDTFRPAVAVWLNFAPDHLDRHPTLEAYRRAKLRIFENQGPDDWAVVRAGEEIPLPSARLLTFSAFGRDADFTLAGGVIRFRGEPVMEFGASRLRGLHNAENLMAALAVAHARGHAFGAVVPALLAYAPRAHRCEPVGTVRGIEFINDSKATNLHALESALRALPERVVLIAGGKDKGLDYAPLRELVAERSVAVVTIGEIADALCREWSGAVPCERAATLEEAAARALELALGSPGAAVLLSPGTSSFDMFTGYEQRGERFRAAVDSLAAAEHGSAGPGGLPTTTSAV